MAAAARKIRENESVLIVSWMITRRDYVKPFFFYGVIETVLLLLV